MLLFSERVSIEVVNGETNIAVSVTNNFTINNLVYRLTTLHTYEMVTELVNQTGRQNQVQFKLSVIHSPSL